MSATIRCAACVYAGWFQWRAARTSDGREFAVHANGEVPSATRAVGAAAGGRIVDAASFNALFLIAGAVAAVSGALLVTALRSGPRAASAAEPDLA